MLSTQWWQISLDDRDSDNTSQVDISMVKIQHLVSLFTLLGNNLVNACQELSLKSDIKVERMSRHL